MTKNSTEKINFDDFSTVRVSFFTLLAKNSPICWKKLMDLVGFEPTIRSGVQTPLNNIFSNLIKFIWIDFFRIFSIYIEIFIFDSDQSRRVGSPAPVIIAFAYFDSVKWLHDIALDPFDHFIIQVSVISFNKFHSISFNFIQFQGRWSQVGR